MTKTLTRVCCCLKPPALMDFRAALIVLCLHLAHTVAVPVKREAKDEALKETIGLVLEAIQSTLIHLNDPSLVQNISCGSLNVSEMLEPEREPLIAQISSIRCNMEKFSNLIPELAELLRMSMQYLQDIEISYRGKPVFRKCSLPAFDDTLDIYLCAKCLLQLVKERLSNLNV